MNFQKRKLLNGITVLHEKRNLPVVSLSISNPYAASHETSEIKGLAHFIEHLVFTGTTSRTHEDISREIEKKGGILNAFTAQDVTSFWFKLPSKHLFAGLDILTDLIKNPTFDEEKFEKEKKVVLEEIKMYHDMPQSHIHEKLLKNMYEKPFGEGIIGSKETVSALKRDFVFEHFKKKYSPGNLIVTIVGEADFERVCEYLEKTFEPKSENLKAEKITKKSGHTVEERPGIDQAHFLFGVHAPMPDDKNKYVLEVLDAHLADGMSSKLFLEIREKRGLAYVVKSSIDMEKNYSYYSIYVGTTKAAIPKVKQLILQGFEDIKDMTETNIKEAKERLIGLKEVVSEESSQTMNALLFEELAGDAEKYYEYENNINAVTLEQVKQLAKSITKKYSTAAIVPK